MNIPKTFVVTLTPHWDHRALNWCHEQFGTFGEWDAGQDKDQNMIFWFNHSEDAVLFTLRWKWQR
jgi:hypothetical protein